MNKHSISMEFPIGNPFPDRNCYYDPVTAAIVVTGVAAGAGAVEARKSRKAAASQAKKTEAEAKKAQEATAALASEEEAEANKKLDKARARVLKGKTKSDLLFGTEKGVEGTAQDTLGV